MAEAKQEAFQNVEFYAENENSHISGESLCAMFRKNAYAETIVSLAGEGYETD
ncbi:hypothetical protein [Yersinia artesiana]|uniref:hypothetical protein n=1 Tax=Yersinia artesiana TaxID=2890315 RepID=UPI001581502D|nr:hypothetical protein [Yersinia artesiana]